VSGGSIHVVQATAWYPPHSIGGTESYVEDLVEALAARDVASTVLVPAEPGAADRYVHAGRAVETYPVDAIVDRDEASGLKPPRQFAVFRERLRAHPNAIYHQQSWSRGCGPLHLRTARELGLRTVLTIHVPGVICLRGTMLRFGQTVCDGRVEERACGACWAQWRGLPSAAATCVATLPLPLVRRLRHGRTRLATALAARALGAERSAQLRDMVDHADRIVVVCRWLAEALAANGVPASKMVMSRQGLSDAFVGAASSAPPRKERGARMRLLYLGRWESLKGIDVVVRAVRATSIDVGLTIRAVAANAADRPYEAKVRRLARDDPRIDFAGAVHRRDVLAEIGRHDILVVPSVCLETGPLVVLEARAAGVFVLGSRLGGIAELVEDGVDGELVEPGDPAAWARAIERLAQRWALGALAPIARPVRTMSAVAADMVDLYRSL
jgi:glycosyltransferase involved in cell wall biosynthesis